MADTNFSDILDRSPTEVEKPKPIAAGTYSTILLGVPRFDKSAKKGTPFVEFTHKFLAPGDDVDGEDLAASLAQADGTAKKLTDVTMRNTFYLTEGSAWRLKDFLGHCGFDVDSDDQSLREMVESSAGRQVNVYVKHTPSQDGKSVFAEIGSTAAAE